MLDSEASVRILFVLVMLVALGMRWIAKDIVLADSSSYLSLAYGILEGRFTQWYLLDMFIPDTWRTPGFPLYLAGIIELFGTEEAIYWIQLILYSISVWLGLLIVQRYDKRPIIRSFFLLLLLPMINIPFYIWQVYPEIPALIAITASAHIITRPQGLDFIRAVALGALLGFAFQCRPVFLFLPFVLLLLDLIFQRGQAKRVKLYLLAIGIYILTLLPFGLWNLEHHGVFKLTPLEGGGGTIHFGYWAGKIPGYRERFYWYNFTGDEMIRFVPEEEVPENISKYEAEWEDINKQLEPFLDHQDSVMLSSSHLFDRPMTRTYNTAYTVERERLLMERSIQHMKEDPTYVVLYKTYSAIRLWVIGIQVGDFRQASFMDKMKLVYPSLVTGVIFLLSLVVIPIAYYRNRHLIGQTYHFLAVLVYTTVIHLPFVIQARYTTPVRIIMVILICVCLARLLKVDTSRKYRPGI